MSKYTSTERLNIYEAMIVYLVLNSDHHRFICTAMERVCAEEDHFTSEFQTFRFMREHLPELWSVRRTPEDLRAIVYENSCIFPITRVIGGDCVLRLWFAAGDFASRVELLHKAIKLVVV